MPALINHHLFGEQAVRDVPAGLVSSEEELIAFLIGNQGPDPLFFRWRAPLSRCAESVGVAQALHNAHPTRTLESLRDATRFLSDDDRRLGMAFALGFLAHYQLDRTTHPLVYAQEYRIIDMADGLDDAEGPVHAIVEGDLDSAMLWRMRHASVRDSSPAGCLVHTARISQAAGALVSQAVLASAHKRMGPAWFGGCLDDMRAFYLRCEPAGRPLSVALGAVERRFRPHAQTQAMSHPVVETDACPWANDGHEAWTDPFTGVESTASFQDLFDEALAGWPDMARSFSAGDEVAGITGHVDFSGRDLGPSERSVEGTIELARPWRRLRPEPSSQE
ncbi:MAG: zinc dependent phospholipase C family protein [Atopobiaceae bacterium]|jgi:hypothetical protein|nr:zinc dependent phospholipase C family protein [Atopobiaceae bacterium]